LAKKDPVVSVRAIHDDNSLHSAACLTCLDTILVSEDVLASAQCQQFARPEKKRWIAQPAERRLPKCESLEDQHALRRERFKQRREVWPIQVVGNDDDIKTLIRKRPLVAFEITAQNFDRRNPGKRLKRPSVTVDCKHVRPKGCQKPNMPSRTTGEVESTGAWRNQVRPAPDPCRNHQVDADLTSRASSHTLGCCFRTGIGCLSVTAR
jgi:hypothetical protein